MRYIRKRYEVIANGDSPPPKRTVDGIEKSYPPTTAEEKLERKNELKARGTLLMAFLNEHQLKFNSYKNAKSLIETIKKRFGGNKESKKVQKTLLKQQYENFNENSSEGLDQIYDKISGSVNQAHGSNSANNDSLKEMDLKWQMARLTMRARIFLKKNERKGSKGKQEQRTCKEECDSRNYRCKCFGGLRWIWVKDKYKTGVGYYSVLPPYTGNFMPHKPDLILANVDDEDENETETKSKQRKPSFAKVEFVKPNEQVKTPRESIKHEEHSRQAKHPRKNSQSPRVNSARPVLNAFNRAHSHDKRPINNKTTSKNNKIYHKINTVRAKHVNTARPKVNIARPKAVLNAVQRNQATAKVNTINGEERIQALVNKKKLIITKTSVRSDLQLEYDKGTECLSNATIIEQLTLMGAKTTTWNEFSSTMASAIICLATNQKFNFSKYIFDNMVKNLEGEVKFLMFLRFMQVFLDKQVEGMFKHKEIYVTPSHTKKVFANIKRQGKDFSGRVTPLFPQKELEVVADEAVYEEMYDNVERAATTATGLDAEKDRGIISKTQFTITLNEPSSIRTSSGSEPRCQETIGDAAAQTRVLALETTKTNQALEVESLKRRVKKLEKKVSKGTHKLNRLYKIGFSRRIEYSDEASLGDQEDASKQRRIIDNLDADEGVKLVDETQGRNDQDMFDISILDDKEVVAEKEVSTADPVTTAGEVVTTAGVEVSATATTPIISMDDITLAKSLAALKSAKPMTRAEGSYKRAREELESDKSKKQKVEAEVDNDQDEAKMKMYMKIVPDDEEAIDAIHLATNPPIIVDWKIIKEGKINSYHII
nr:hypothetical protein [Tanacetum cinerariifolium]